MSGQSQDREAEFVKDPKRSVNEPASEEPIPAKKAKKDYDSDQSLLLFQNDEFQKKSSKEGIPQDAKADGEEGQQEDDAAENLKAIKLSNGIHVQYDEHVTLSSTSDDGGGDSKDVGVVGLKVMAKYDDIQEIKLRKEENGYLPICVALAGEVETTILVGVEDKGHESAEVKLILLDVDGKEVAHVSVIAKKAK